MNNTRKIPDSKSATIKRNAGRSVLWKLVLLGFVLLGVGGWMFYLQENTEAEPWVLAMLGMFAMFGVMFLFLLALDLIQLTAKCNVDGLIYSVLSEMDSGLMVTDQKGRIVYANEAYSGMTGARTIDDIVSIEVIFSQRLETSEVIYQMAKNAREGKSGVEEFRLPSGLKSSEKGDRWFRLHAQPMAAKGYGKSLVLWQAQDVTADRVGRETTFQGLQNAIDYLDHAPAGFFSSDHSGGLAYINATLADWLGIDLAQFQPGSIHLKDIIVGEGIALLDVVKPDNEEVSTATIDLDLLRSDGKILPVRLYHRVSFALDGAPGVARTLVINRDMIPNNERKLQAAEVRFVRFFNNTPMALASINSQGLIVRANALFHRFFGKTLHLANQSTTSGRGVKYAGLAVTKEDQNQLEEMVESALSGKAHIEPVEIGLPGNDNQFARFFACPITDDVLSGEMTSGEDEKVIVYAMETTDQRALEQQFAQSQKMQAVGQLAGGIAHDFNNVLTAITGFSDLLLASHRPSDPSFRDIINIKQNASRAASLVRQLLAFSRRQTLRPQVLRLADVLSDLRVLLGRLLGEKIRLEVIHGRDLWLIKADISQFEQVVVNLCVNARDAMPEGGKLTITTSNVSEAECTEKFKYPELVPSDFVMMEIKDEGAGIPEQELEKIFEPFYTTKEVGKGTGLGLSTVYGIVKQTGGGIHVDSIEGEGTTFRVFLPRHIPVPTEEGVAQSTNGDEVVEKKDLTGSAKILLVEDEDAVRTFAARALSSRGYEVHEAINGAEALEVMERLGGEIDLIVSDVVMPEMDGPTLLKEIRRNYPDLKFVFMSGYAEDAFAKSLSIEERENFGFLPKPYSLKQLATAVKEMID